MSLNVAVIGGGAAGFFAAISVKTNFSNARVTIYERSNKLLSKVRVSGGGRCNVTNNCNDIHELCKAYPRGGKELRSLFYEWGTTETRNWFEDRGVPLYAQSDDRVFPVSNDSLSIVNCLLNEVDRLDIKIEMNAVVSEISCVHKGISLSINGIDNVYDKVIIATGGSPKKSNLDWLAKLGHEIIDPVPSLFTFNMPNEDIRKLMGVSLDHAIVSIQGTKLKSSGALLITHWGMSGPAVLKLSSYVARVLYNMNYNCQIAVNWVNESNNGEVQEAIKKIMANHPQKLLSNIKPMGLPERLWLYLLNKIELDVNKKWSELSKKSLNQLVNILCNDQYSVEGKTTFKEEFVTCGGISLQSINSKTMQSKMCSGLYFAGEILDIDGITGGYNFQAAWTTGHIAGRLS